MTANIMTGVRIVCAVALLFFPAFSPAFYALYLVAGISDMIDGTVARKTGSVSVFGSKPDTVADFVLVVCCMIRLLPVLDIPTWLLIWIAAIAAIKAGTLIAGYVKQRRFVAPHTVMNKATGVLLFAFPLTLKAVDLKVSGAVVAAAATFAAVQEGYFVIKGPVGSACADSRAAGNGEDEPRR